MTLCLQFQMLLQISSSYQQSDKQLVYILWNHVHARNIFFHYVTLHSIEIWCIPESSSILREYKTEFVLVWVIGWLSFNWKFDLCTEFIEIVFWTTYRFFVGFKLFCEVKCSVDLYENNQSAESDISMWTYSTGSVTFVFVFDF